MIPCTIKLLAAVLVLSLTGCVTDVANRYYSDVQYPPKEVEQVEILKGRPSRPFTVIADLQSRGETPQGMRKRAAKIGADAVIITHLGGDVSVSSEWAGQNSLNTYTRLIGTAIKYN